MNVGQQKPPMASEVSLLMVCLGAFENKNCGGDAKENLDGEVARPQESAEARVTQAFLTCQSC